MEETLGKRIVANRKRLGITQDKLAEQLGVTAQAVSKWENDQSCPDITMLPKLAEIFGISVDALLGISQQKQEPVHEAEIVTETEDKPKHNWEFRWNSGRKGSVGIAVWIILTAGWLFGATYLHLDVSFWDLLWTNGLLVFGLFGLFPKFDFLRLGCALFGAYFLLDKLNAIPFSLGRELLLPAGLLLFGLSLLIDALRQPRKPSWVVTHNGKIANKKTGSCTTGEDSFECSTAFCENSHWIDLPQLRRGDIDVSFGELTVDLTGCQKFAYGCYVNADCSFGDLTILVPCSVRAEVDSDAAFGSVDIRGDCDREASDTIHINADVSFGQITVKYV